MPTAHISTVILRALTRAVGPFAVLACVASLLLVAPVGAQTPEPAAQLPVSESEISDDEIGKIAAAPASVPHGTTIEVEVHGPDMTAVSQAIEGVGGEIYGEVPGFFVEARVAVDKLEALNASEAVVRVANVTLAMDKSPKSLTTNDALAVTVAETLELDAWHSVGHTGAGQKVGILDIFGTEQLEYAISQGRVPAPTGAFCQDRGSSCAVTFRNGGPHGVSVAEIIHRMAPDAELYFATVTTLSDLTAAIDWFAEQGVTIINRSETSELDGPGDGTGPTASLVDRAVSEDMVWVAAAGNASGSSARKGQNWLGTFNDPDNNGFHNWADGSERMAFTCGFIAGMRWDDWDDDSIATDYDIFIYDEANDRIPEARGENTQNEKAHRPLEHIETVCSGPGDRDYLAIRRFDDPQPDGADTIQILSNLTSFDEWVNEGAATGPGADSANPGAITVGATRSALDLDIADYSSHGPTSDGRNGVDIIAPSCLPVPDFFNFCFSGTSASAPVMAGAIAVLRGARVIETASDADQVIADIAEDRGVEGPDPEYGHGSLRMPPPAFFGARTFLPECQGVPATLVGTSGDDVLTGTDGRDVIVGGRGDDVISGLGGNDLICGGFGDDRIDGGFGDDEMLGGPGADDMFGRDGDDTVLGGHGHDDLEGNAGNDEVRGFTGRDYVKGGLGDDAVYGGAGADRLIGGKGLDELYGGNGVDRCREPIEVAVSCRG